MRLRAGHDVRFILKATAFIRSDGQEGGRYFLRLASNMNQELQEQQKIRLRASWR